jgi:hypothetical protein
VHLVSAANSPQLGFFEFDPGWLWQGAEELPDQDSMVVVDPGEHCVRGHTAAGGNTAHVRPHAGRGARRRAAGAARLATGWRGVARRHGRLDPQSAWLSGAPWNVVVYGKLAQARPAALSFINDVLPLLLLAAARFISPPGI